MAGTPHIADVTIECTDPERLAAFWSAVLDRPIGGRKGPYVWLEHRELGFGFQRVETPSPGKARIHVDVAVPDLRVSKEQVEALGGRRADGYDAGGFLVMEDPEGNVFCLIPMSPFKLDEQGRTTYLEGSGL